MQIKEFFNGMIMEQTVTKKTADKKLKEKNKKKKQREQLAREKQKYYDFYDDVKTFARDNGEW